MCSLKPDVLEWQIRYRGTGVSEHHGHGLAQDGATSDHYCVAAGDIDLVMGQKLALPTPGGQNPGMLPHRHPSLT
jgi:hypothetical protein